MSPVRFRAVFALAVLAPAPIGCGDSESVGSGGSPPQGGGTSAGGHDAGGGAIGGMGPTDPCAGLVMDTAAHPMQDAAKPGLLEPITDAAFGTTILRVTEAPAGGVIKPMYSTIPAWSAGESYLLLYQVEGGHLLYDGKTYAFMRALDIAPPDLEQVFWDPTDDDSLLYVDDHDLVRYRVSTDSSEVVHTFDNCTEGPTSGDDPMYISWDGDAIGLSCDGGGFAYRLSTDSVSAPAAGAAGFTTPQAAPSGQRFFSGGRVFDADMNQLLSLDLAAAEHASQGALPTGEDLYCAVAYDPGPAGSPVGTLVVYDMATGAAREVIGPDNGYPYPPGGTHISAVAHRNPGWVALSIIGEHVGAELLDGEIVLANAADGGDVCRVAHHHSFGSDGPQGYWAEPHAVISPTGTRIAFGSDWGGTDTVDTYVVELPSYAD